MPEAFDNVTPLPSIQSRFAAAAQADARTRTIEVRPDAIHQIASEGEDALLDNDAALYVRGGIVRPVVDELPAAGGKRTKVARLCRVDAVNLIDHLSRAAHWVKFNARKNGLVPTDPPATVAAVILARDGEWRFRKLVGVLTTPTLRPDGTILSSPGYDPDTRLLLLSPPSLPAIADRPTRADAQAALAILDGLLAEFPFVDDASRSAALSALMTPVVRGAMSAVPAHVTTAPVPGSGKSYIIDIASGICAGERAPVMAAGRKEEETEKRLDAALLSGQPIISIDNVNGELGGEKLCQVIERPVVAVRRLGGSDLIKVDNRSTCFATGNNIQLVGDMTRRVILCSLDPNMERPELREFRAKPFDIVIANRGKFIAAILTIARAYAVAGFPGELPALASFEDWSRIVRSALVWLGRADPVDTMEAAREDDPITGSLRHVMIGLYNAVQSAWRSTAEIKRIAEERVFDSLARPDFHQALKVVAEDRRGDIDPTRLGRFLARHKGRIVGELKLNVTDDKHAKTKLWSVSRV